MSELPTIAKHAKEHGIEPLKALGQNFLFDSSLCAKIARCGNITDQDIVIEIGPGPAGLTRAILENNPKKLIVIERDNRCIALLKDIKSFYPQLQIIENDALKINIKEILDQSQLAQNSKVKILANLPYNIATTLILNWFKELDYIESINVMVQREVADRICAVHSTKAYGRLSIISQLVCDVKKLFDVSPEAFYPKPKIWSSIISFLPKEHRPNRDEIAVLEKITHAAFGMRRKMLKTSLKSLVPDELMDKNHYNLRAENLTPLDYLSMARKMTLLKG